MMEGILKGILHYFQYNEERLSVIDKVIDVHIGFIVFNRELDS